MKLLAHQRLRLVLLACVRVRCTSEIKHLRSAHKFGLYLQAPYNPNKPKHVEGTTVSLSGPGFESLHLHYYIIKKALSVTNRQGLFVFQG